jgi:hypothetical protein
MKVFQVDDVTWYAANSAEEATRLYVEDSETDETVLEFGPAQEVSDESLDRMNVVHVDEPGQPKQTFREFLSVFTQPGFFAGTEY